MVTIKITRNNQQEIIGYRVRGHAQTAPYGEDIVCAAVSVLAQTTIMGLNQVLGQRPKYKMAEGDLSCKVEANLPKTEREKTSILLETMLVGLKNIQQQYPQYIAIDDEEV